MNIQRKTLMPAAIALILLMVCSNSFPHCEIPCGIYDDAMRIKMMEEHIRTIEKSMNQIHQIQNAATVNNNQLVRWIANKEHHADQLSDIVTQYFMTQRISPAEESNAPAYQAYVEKLTLLHKLMVYAMKCKQTTDLDNVVKLKETLKKFETAYFEKSASTSPPKPHRHAHED